MRKITPCVWFDADGEEAAVSFQVMCESQDEVDTYWSPARLPELLQDPDRERSQRVMAAMLEMRKIDVRAVERAAAAA